MGVIVVRINIRNEKINIKNLWLFNIFFKLMVKLISIQTDRTNIKILFEPPLASVTIMQDGWCTF